MSKLVYGVGINDTDYSVQPKLKGKKLTRCPFYSSWSGMLHRCYSPCARKRQPTYAGCTVSEDWLVFSNFKKWMEAQDWQGKHLDKDIMFPGNKVYSAETCVFVTQKINNLIHGGNPHKDGRSVGVRCVKIDKIYTAQIKKFGKAVHLGSFKALKDAEQAFRKARRLYILTVACCEKDIRVKQGLYRHSEMFR